MAKETDSVEDMFISPCGNPDQEAFKSTIVIRHDSFLPASKDQKVYGLQILSPRVRLYARPGLCLLVQAKVGSVMDSGNTTRFPIHFISSIHSASRLEFQSFQNK